MTYSRSNTKRALAAIGAGALLIGALSACTPGGSGDGDKPSSGGTQADIDAALEKGGTLTWWTWGDEAQLQADAFTKEHPNVKFDIVMMDNPGAVVTKVQNAVKAGKGAPDLIPVEYQTVPQLAMGGALADMSDWGLGDYADEFIASSWEGMQFQGKQTGIPLDSGPMVLIYNKDLFDAAGISAPPKTWDEYSAAAAAIHAHDPEAYLANSGDAGFMTSMFWAAGGQPFKTEGENVTIDVEEPKTKQFIDFWSDELASGNYSSLSTWSDEWSKALTQGKLGSLLMGGWMISGMDDYSTGNWRVAQIPSFDGSAMSAMNGGSGLAVSEQSENKALAAAVLQFMATGEGRTIQNTNGFPGTTAIMDDPAWLDVEFPAYDGQKANQEGKLSSENVVAGWQYLPFQGYANDIFADTAGKAIADGTSLSDGLLAWQDDLVAYGNEQGFSVNK
ncbi:sugar ABC transporter substrate-binding protein [Microbacterium sp. H1-D42]|uniref:ABC transporter substrate-binding protein n=1 Tax=Microbacterium sp. H1-D42 TaxID=2925844 RepID=UPI001F53822C|nr:sugar ABC transporter substrate-binding protein [Microbacterium sp. H1-D42]UNK72077.1 sugar ABC transporter substrate-binding protein [Microbacterium sp. H1-D42]